MSDKRCITFEAFMQAALHDPKRGYYARNIRAVGGGRADFTTVPMHFGETLARAVAGWAVDAMRKSGCRDLIEIGPGEGRLMRDVLRHLPWTMRLRTRVHFVETSAILEDRQRATFGRRASWHRNPQEALRTCDGKAVIFSNELVDAFPVRIFQKNAEGWRELGVEMDDGGRVTREHLLDVESLPDSSIFEIPHTDGQRVEIHEAYHTWLAGWLPQWKAGEMLTIDYGDAAASLYHRRPHGTVRGYLLHQRVTGPDIYQNVGMQDLTADVNFTDLARWASPWCEADSPQTLSAFLRERVGNSAPHDLTEEHHAGGAFRVLRQSVSRRPHEQGTRKICARIDQQAHLALHFLISCSCGFSETAPPAFALKPGSYSEARTAAGRTTSARTWAFSSASAVADRRYRLAHERSWCGVSMSAFLMPAQSPRAAVVFSACAR
jgi:SAM-dependent MidA family methyltransferase